MSGAEAFRSTGAYVDPICAHSLPGIPPSFLAAVKGRLNFENFLGDETAGRSAEQYADVSSGGAAVTSARLAPDSGDVVTRGLWRLTLAPDPVAAMGHTRRQGLDLIAIDGFDRTRPTLYAVRFRVKSVEPTALTYELWAGGLFLGAAPTWAPQDGASFAFQPGTGWVLRTTRAAVSVDSAALDAFDADYHVAAFLHVGTNLIPAWDGVIFGGLGNIPELQPSTTITANIARMITVGAAAVTPIVDTDWVLWGS